MQEWTQSVKKAGKDKMGHNMEALCDTFMSLGFTLAIIRAPIKL